MVITVRHRCLPFGRISVPLLSVGVYLLAWCLRVGVRFVPTKKLKEQRPEIPIDPRTLGPLVTKAAWVLLCSGSYTLVDVKVVEEGVGVRVRLI